MLHQSAAGGTPTPEHSLGETPSGSEIGTAEPGIESDSNAKIAHATEQLHSNREKEPKSETDSELKLETDPNLQTETVHESEMVSQALRNHNLTNAIGESYASLLKYKPPCKLKAFASMKEKGNKTLSNNIDEARNKKSISGCKQTIGSTSALERFYNSYMVSYMVS